MRIAVGSSPVSTSGRSSFAHRRKSSARSLDSPVQSGSNRKRSIWPRSSASTSNTASSSTPERAVKASVPRSSHTADVPSRSQDSIVHTVRPAMNRSKFAAHRSLSVAPRVRPSDSEKGRSSSGRGWSSRVGPRKPSHTASGANVARTVATSPSLSASTMNRIVASADRGAVVAIDVVSGGVVVVSAIVVVGGGGGGVIVDEPEGGVVDAVHAAATMPSAAATSRARRNLCLDMP